MYFLQRRAFMSTLVKNSGNIGLVLRKILHWQGLQKQGLAKTGGGNLSRKTFLLPAFTGGFYAYVLLSIQIHTYICVSEAQDFSTVSSRWRHIYTLKHDDEDLESTLASKLQWHIHQSEVHRPYMNLHFCFGLIQQVVNIAVRYIKLQNAMTYGPKWCPEKILSHVGHRCMTAVASTSTQSRLWLQWS